MKFLISVTYSITTPESIKLGDFEETGYEIKNEIYTLSELIHLIQCEGFYRNKGTNWFTTDSHTVCYREDRQEEKHLHIELITNKKPKT